MTDRQEQRKREIELYAAELAARRGLLNKPYLWLAANRIMREESERHDRRTKGRKNNHDERKRPQ